MINTSTPVAFSAKFYKLKADKNGPTIEKPTEIADRAQNLDILQGTVNGYGAPMYMKNGLSADTNCIQYTSNSAWVKIHDDDTMVSTYKTIDGSSNTNMIIMNADDYKKPADKKLYHDAVSYLRKVSTELQKSERVGSIVPQAMESIEKAYSELIDKFHSAKK